MDYFDRLGSRSLSLWAAACLLWGCGLIRYEHQSASGDKTDTDLSANQEVFAEQDTAAISVTEPCEGDACLLTTDEDRDGFCVGGGTNLNPEEDGDCRDPGETTSGPIGDCQDDDAGVSPGAAELCNFRDDNCNDDVDEGDVCPAGFTPIDVEPAGWLLSSDTANWETAFNRCRNIGEGWHLARADLVAKVEASYAYLVDGPNGAIWTGGNDRAVEGEYRWVDNGDLFTTGEFQWNLGEPSDTTEENCVQIRNNFGDRYLNDVSCDAVIRYLCEFFPDKR